MADDAVPVQQRSTTIHESVAWSPRWIIFVVLLILVGYFLLQKILLTETEPDEDLRWLDQWDVAAASGESVASRNKWLRTAFAAAPPPVETGAEETGAEETGAEETGAEETGAEGTGAEDTGAEGAGVPPPLARTLRRLTQAAQQADGDVLLDSIDWPTYLETMRQNKYFRRGKDKQSLKAWAQAGVLYPWSWDRFQVIYFDENDRNRHRVLTLLLDSSGHFHEVRWWFIVRDGEWLVYDWEVIDFGLRESTEAALEWSLRGHPSLRAYDELLFTDRSDPSFFEQTLPIPAPFRDSLYVQLAYDYLEAEQWEVALRMADRVRRPDIAIGASVVRGQAHLFLGQNKQATEATDRLFKDVGPSIHVLELRTAIESVEVDPM